MPFDRYKNVPKIKILNDSYEEFFNSKKIDFIVNNTTQAFNNINLKQDFSITQHTWKNYDSFASLSQRYYNDPRYWFLIALTNNKPTEYNVEDGEILNIYFSLENLLSFYGI